MSQSVQLMIPSLTPMVKRLLIVTAACWFVLVVVVQGFFLENREVFQIFGLVPAHFLYQFYFWQPLTYLFLHSESVFHVVFNLLILWMFGSEIEAKWGAKPFLVYYLVCGVGAAVIYLVGSFVYAFFSGQSGPLGVPVVGASGAVFGLILAYGVLFGERVVYFMMIFPMKAKYFALILGAVEFFNLLNSGLSSQIANLAHLGGLISGFVYLFFWTKLRRGPRQGLHQKGRRRLKLVVNNNSSERSEANKGPRYWN